MSALLLSEIPTAIAKVEQLHAYTSILLADLHRGIYYKESNDAYGSVPICTTTIGEAADGTDRLITRSAIPLDPTWRTDGTSPIWMFGDDIRDVVVPALYKAA